MDKLIYDEEFDWILMDVILGIKVVNSEELFINWEKFDDIELKMVEFLSDFEWKVFVFYLDG